jgi:hypothetical protein
LEVAPVASGIAMKYSSGSDHRKLSPSRLSASRVATDDACE